MLLVNQGDLSKVRINESQTLVWKVDMYNVKQAVREVRKQKDKEKVAIDKLRLREECGGVFETKSRTIRDKNTMTKRGTWPDTHHIISMATNAAMLASLLPRHKTWSRAFHANPLIHVSIPGGEDFFVSALL